MYKCLGSLLALFPLKPHGRPAGSYVSFDKKKTSKRKVQEVPQSQTAALPSPKRKRKPTNLNKHKPNKRTKSTKVSSLFPKRGNRNTKRTEKHKNKMTHGKTYNLFEIFTSESSSINVSIFFNI